MVRIGEVLLWTDQNWASHWRGGGYRASLFPQGVLRRMAELDLPRFVEVLSAISGGFIIGALNILLLTLLKVMLWPVSLDQGMARTALDCAAVEVDRSGAATSFGGKKIGRGFDPRLCRADC